MVLTQYICTMCGQILRGGPGEGHKEGCVQAQYELRGRVSPGDYRIEQVEDDGEESKPEIYFG